MAIHPLELVHLDYLCLEPGKGLDENVLVVTDHFTRYAQVYVTRTQTSQMTAKTLRDKFIVHYGFPKKILMDQGQNFESQLVADLCELMGVQKIWTSPYHLQTNGQCERFNSTLINMLGTLPKTKKSEWKNHIGTLVHTYNCTWNSATGFSPYYLMYGRQPHLPVDVTLGLAPHTITEPNTSKFVQKMGQCTKWAQRRWGNAPSGLKEKLKSSRQKRHRWNYDKRGRAGAFEVGDTVLVHVTTFKGHHKIQDRWDNREYVVEKWPYPNVSVYVVCPRDGEGCSQTLHRNYLLPINTNIEQGKTDKPLAGVGNITSLTPVPPVDSAHADAGSSGMTTASTAGSTPQGSPDKSASLRCGTRTTWNWLPWRYQNFGLLADTGPTSIWDA